MQAVTLSIGADKAMKMMSVTGLMVQERAIFFGIASKRVSKFRGFKGFFCM